MCSIRRGKEEVFHFSANSVLFGRETVLDLDGTLESRRIDQREGPENRNCRWHRALYTFRNFEEHFKMWRIYSAPLHARRNQSVTFRFLSTRSKRSESEALSDIGIALLCIHSIFPRHTQGKKQNFHLASLLSCRACE